MPFGVDWGLYPRRAASRSRSIPSPWGFAPELTRPVLLMPAMTLRLMPFSI